MKRKPKIKSKFIYPDIINQAYVLMRQMGLLVAKADIFKVLTENGYLTPDGQPTDKAIRNGLVLEAKELPITPEMGPIERLKAQAPVYQRFSDDHFRVDPDTGAVEADDYVISTLALDIIEDPLATNDEKQLARSLLREICELQ